MKKKQLLVLAAVLVLLVAGVLIRQAQKPAGLAIKEYEGLDLAFDSGAIEKIKVGKGGKCFAEIVKTVDAWRIPALWNTKADPLKINRVLRQIRELQGELRGDDPSLLADFGISDKEAYQIVLLGASDVPVLDLKLGLKSATPRSGFVRDGRTNRVYYAETFLFEEIGASGRAPEAKQNANFWADLNLFRINFDQATRLQISRFKKGKPEIVTDIMRNDTAKTEWAYATKTGFEIDRTKVQEFMDLLSVVRASGVLDPGLNHYGFDHPEWELKLGFAGAPDFTLTIGFRDENAKIRFAKVSAEKTVFQISDYFFKEIDADNKYFAVDQEPPSVPAEK